MFNKSYNRYYLSYVSSELEITTPLIDLTDKIRLVCIHAYSIKFSQTDGVIGHAYVNTTTLEQNTTKVIINIIIIPLIFLSRNI